MKIFFRRQLLIQNIALRRQVLHLDRNTFRFFIQHTQEFSIEAVPGCDQGIQQSRLFFFTLPNRRFNPIDFRLPPRTFFLLLIPDN